MPSTNIELAAIRFADGEMQPRKTRSSFAPSGQVEPENYPEINTDYQIGKWKVVTTTSYKYAMKMIREEMVGHLIVDNEANPTTK